MDLTPLTLRGAYLTLEPIEERHAPDLFVAMQDEEVCRYLAWPPPTRLEETLAFVRDAREVMARGSWMDAPVGPEIVNEFSCRQRRAEYVALAVHDPVREQPVDLRPGLHALGDGVQP